MDRNDILSLLKDRGIYYEITLHEAVFDMAGSALLDLPHPRCVAKNLFVHDEGRRNWYLLCIKGDKRVDLKAFRRQEGIRALSFASAMELDDHLHLPAGSVTPLGLLNDETRSVVLYLDEDFREGEGIVGVHPNDNTATVWLHWRDLTDLLASQGCTIHVCHMPGEGVETTPETGDFT